MIKYLLGLDIGTSATKTVLFDETMKVIASASEESNHASTTKWLGRTKSKRLV